jgi:signal transduction histidine kinase/CheY-like chemotaxis protein
MTPGLHLRRPSLAVALGACLLLAGLFGFLALYIYPDRLLPLTYGLALLLTFWHRNRALHYSQVGVYSAMVLAELGLAASGPEETPGLLALAMKLTNIWTVGIVIDRIMVYYRRLRSANRSLEEANAELVSSNEELAAREEEINAQNEELRRQSEELERQAEELQREGEKTLRLHRESIRRERILQALLEVSTSLGDEGGKSSAAARICEAAAMAFGRESCAALLIADFPGRMVVRGQCGFGGDAGGLLETEPLDPFARLVIEEGRTACIENLELTPEMSLPAAAGRGSFRAVLGSPLKADGEVLGILEVFSAVPRGWSQEDFRVIEWLAAQGTLILEAIRLQNELDSRSRDAEAASVRKTRFLAAVSHDVRTPANAIGLLADLINNMVAAKELDEIPEMTGILYKNARMLVELVSDVLDLTRFDSGKVELELGEVGLCDVIESELSQYGVLARAAGLELVAELPAERIWIRTDRTKLARILGNLMGNAIKFTEVGTVRVVCAPAARGAVEVRVEDTGVGISPEHLEHIFDEFFQIKNPERDRSKGSGLGLAICKRLVDALGLEISVASKLDAGSTFTVVIPEKLVIERRARERAAGNERGGSREVLSGYNVLVVEDHEATRLAISGLLVRKGATVEQAEDGRTALRMLGHSPPDVLLLDLMLPDMDGREILKQLIDNRPAALRCLLAVTGDLTEARRHEIKLLGADALVPKPIQMEALVEQIARRLDPRSSLKSA